MTRRVSYRVSIGFFLLAILLSCSGCGQKPVTLTMTATAYCGCSSCCSWERGSPRYFHLDFWNRYVSAGPGKGREYTGLTASNTYPREPQEGLFSFDSLKRPYMIPIRTILFPWYFLPEKGTIAADTRYYPFGTEMYVPGYGWGVVEDRGGAIKGPYRIDLYFDSHQDALEWGRRKVNVEIYKP
ncbi:MAG: 3D domain-containing protein [Desulfopila sp.]|nr:3D domain-containing protein [Desulfopila sp.]